MTQLYYDEQGFAHKFCPKCETLYDESEKHFHKQTSKSDGLRVHCITCRSVATVRKVWGTTYQIGSSLVCRTCNEQYILTPSDFNRPNQPYLDCSECRNNHRRTHRKNSTEQYRAADNAYYAAHKDIKKARVYMRRFIGVDIQAVIDRYGMWCYICQQPILQDQDMHLDHRIPLTRDGANTTDNIYLAHAVCNMRKGNKYLQDLTSYDRRGP